MSEGKKILVPLAEGFEEIEFVSIVDTLRRADIKVVIAGVGEPKKAGEVYRRGSVCKNLGANANSEANSQCANSNANSSATTKKGKNASANSMVANEVGQGVSKKTKLYTGAHGIEISAEVSLDDLDSEVLASFDGVALAGGWQGMLNLKASQKLRKILQEFSAQGRLVSAICASPIVLDSADVLSGKFACYPGCEKFTESSANGEDSITESVGGKNIIDSSVSAKLDTESSIDSSEFGKNGNNINKTHQKHPKGEYHSNASVVRAGNLITAAGPATGILFALEIIAYFLGEAKSNEIAEQMLVSYLQANAKVVRD